MAKVAAGVVAGSRPVPLSAQGPTNKAMSMHFCIEVAFFCFGFWRKALPLCILPIEFGAMVVLLDLDPGQEVTLRLQQLGQSILDSRKRFLSIFETFAVTL